MHLWYVQIQEGICLVSVNFYRRQFILKKVLFITRIQTILEDQLFHKCKWKRVCMLLHTSVWNYWIIFPVSNPALASPHVFLIGFVLLFSINSFIVQIFLILIAKLFYNRYKNRRFKPGSAGCRSERQNFSTERKADTD